MPKHMCDDSVRDIDSSRQCRSDPRKKAFDHSVTGDTIFCTLRCAHVSISFSLAANTGDRAALGRGPQSHAPVRFLARAHVGCSGTQDRTLVKHKFINMGIALSFFTATGEEGLVIIV